MGREGSDVPFIQTARPSVNITGVESLIFFPRKEIRQDISPEHLHWHSSDSLLRDTYNGIIADVSGPGEESRRIYQSRTHQSRVPGQVIVCMTEQFCGKRQILIVDDAELAREIESLFLNHVGCTVVEAEDGVQALDKYQEIRPVLVILDIIMPKLNGIQTLKQLKKIDPTARGFDLHSSR